MTEVSSFPREFGRMDGRVALVTGSSSGMGAAIANAFLDAGARVHAVDIQPQALAERFGQSRVAERRVVEHRLDVSDSDAVLALGSHLADTDPVDTLVCAAGLNLPKRRVAELTAEAWNTLINVNLSGSFYFFRAFLDQLRSRTGDVVFIASVSAAWPDESGAAYSASKAGVLGLARAAGADEHAHGIRVTTLLPGIVNTPLLDKRPVPPPESLRQWMVQPEDIARTCVVAVTLPARTNIAEMTILPTRLQSMGRTQDASPELPEELREP